MKVVSRCLPDRDTLQWSAIPSRRHRASEKIFSFREIWTRNFQHSRLVLSTLLRSRFGTSCINKIYIKSLVELKKYYIIIPLLSFMVGIYSSMVRHSFEKTPSVKKNFCFCAQIWTRKYYARALGHPVNKIYIKSLVESKKYIIIEKISLNKILISIKDRNWLPGDRIDVKKPIPDWSHHFDQIHIFSIIRSSLGT